MILVYRYLHWGYCYTVVLSLQKKNTLEATFKAFENAYKSRKTPFYFNQKALESFDLREVYGLASQIKDPQYALKSIFQIIKNRKHVIGARPFTCSWPIKNEAFVLILHRPNEPSQHAITITPKNAVKIKR